jgi:hypothetical protein
LWFDHIWPGFGVSPRITGQFHQSCPIAMSSHIANPIEFIGSASVGRFFRGEWCGGS